MTKVVLRRGIGDSILIEFPYDAVLVSKVKTLPGRIWLPEQRVWSVPSNENPLSKLRNLFQGHTVEVAADLTPEITEMIRRDIIDYLILLPSPFHGRLEITQFLSRIWDLSAMPSTDGRFHNAEGDIWQHMVNNQDWDEAYLLYKYMEVLRCDTVTFLKFLEECVHPIVRPDEAQSASVVAALNDMLAADGYRLGVQQLISGKPVYKCFLIPDNAQETASDGPYDVVLSYAGEEEEYVTRVAQFLQVRGIRVFFAPNKEHEIWGKDLTEYLDQIYRGDAKFCVMFISQNYAAKVWPTHERRSALAKAVSAKEEYLLPARFDDTAIPGLSPSIAYIDLRKKTPEELGDIILRKLGKRSY